MTTENQPAADNRRGRSAMVDVSARTLVLGLTGILVLAFVVVLGLRIVNPETLSSARQSVSDAEKRDAEVTTTARKVTLAFLDVDYRDMDPRIDKVLALSTGTFRKQYDQTKVNLTAAARQGQAISSGSVRYVGITDIDSDSAVAFVAADSTVSNLAMEEAKKRGEKVDDKRYYRFQLNLSRVSGRWLLNDLQFVS